VQGTQEAKLIDFDNPHCLRVFISTSMTNTAILDYARAANNYGARLVLKGLPGDSWLELAQMVRVLQQELGSDQLALEIDDTAFTAFNVQAVPTIVLSQEERIMDLVAGDLRVKRADQVVGNIGLKNALELFAANGDMADVAQNILLTHSGIR
jgi:type-F conjugative transfer system pilin assembly protein TrbC